MTKPTPCPGCGVNPGFRHYRGCLQSGGAFDDKPYEPKEKTDGNTD